VASEHLLLDALGVIEDGVACVGQQEALGGALQAGVADARRPRPKSLAREVLA
jgi:hypothetical protein